MSPTEILSNEHKLILKVLDALERVGSRAAEERALDLDDARLLIEFLRTFADKCHHGKEEAHLFPALEAHGFSHDTGPIAVMLYEHEQGRAHVRQMAAALDRVAQGEAAGYEPFAQEALRFVALLRDHIFKEDNVLFPMANQVLDAAEQARLVEVFRRVDQEEIGPAVHERMQQLADQLARAYPPAGGNYPRCG